MGVFDDINFDVPKSVDSSFDFRFMETPCDHKLRDEEFDYDITPLLSDTPYSGTGVGYNTRDFDAQINPLASIQVTTKNVFFNDGNLSFRQAVDTTRQNPIEEEFVVPETIITRVTLMYPPKVNSVTAKVKTDLENGDIVFNKFTDYNLYQLPGQVQFTNSQDSGKTVVFKYLSAKKIILEKTKSQLPNWKYDGLTSDGKGIFTIYGRGILSTQSRLFIRYTTTQDRCPKCAGEGILNDINFDAGGRMQLVYDFSKLIQDFFKRINTERGSNIFDINEGSGVPDSIGVAGADRLLLDSLIKSEVVNMLFQIRAKQKTQSDIQGIALGEQIEQINKIDVKSINATDISVTIEVLSKSGVIQQISSTFNTNTGSTFTNQDGSSSNIG